ATKVRRAYSVAGAGMLVTVAGPEGAPTFGVPGFAAERDCSVMPAYLPLIVGELYTRSDLATEYGGSRQGGIIASTKSNSVFIFTDHAEANQFGYVYDGFSADGLVLHYTGAGQDGDQLESHSNSPVLTHAEKGRTLHAFVADGTVPGTQTKRQRYVGEFFLDPAVPFERMPAPGR